MFLGASRNSARKPQYAAEMARNSAPRLSSGTGIRLRVRCSCSYLPPPLSRKGIILKNLTFTGNKKTNRMSANLNLGTKIKKYREAKNYTQEHMAHEMDISQNTYSKLETGGIRLTVDRLMRISEILDIPLEEILSNDNQAFTFNNSNIDKFYGYIETMHEDNKELINTTIKILSDQLAHAQRENEKLLEIIQKIERR